MIDVSVRRRCELRRPGLQVRGRPSLRNEDVLLKSGIPVTAIARTLVDLATELPSRRLERAVNEADKHDLIDPEALRIAVNEYAGQPGVRDLRTLLVNGWEVDFYWPDLGLVIETDGLRYHRTASTQTRDARRDRAHALAGMASLRFTHYEVRYEPGQVREELSRINHLLHSSASDIDLA